MAGVGASAGGLGAITALLKALPATSRMAFVLFQHSAPAHVSMLTDILGRATSMPVREIKEGMTVQPAITEELPEGDENLGKILFLPRQQTGNDFTYYKASTIQRSL